MTVRLIFLYGLLAAGLSGCSPAAFTDEQMLRQLVAPSGFSWSELPATVDQPDRLSAELGSDSAELLRHNWQSSTVGVLSSEGAKISVAVHRLASTKDAARLLSENKYPDAEPVGIGQEAYRWQHRYARDTIFFRRYHYFCQLTIDAATDEPVLLPLAADLDVLLGRPLFSFW